MKYFLKFAMLVAATLCVFGAQAQRADDAHVFGHTIDIKTNEHLPYVTISIAGTPIGVTTDATGHYFIKDLPQGELTFVASCVGYASQEKTVYISKASTVELNFELEVSTFNIGQVVVSSNRNQTNRKDASVIVNTVSAELFDMTSSNSVADALSFQSGLRMEYNCSNCGVPQLRINGLDGQYSQILLDSRPLFSSLAAVYGLEQLPVGMIDRVEIVRGGGSALFGSNAIGGIVNIITKEPMRNSVVLSNNTGFMGSSSDVNTSLNGSFVTDDHKAGVFIFAQIRDRQQYDRDGDGFSDIPKLSSETIGFRGFYRTSNYSKLTLEYHHMREFRRGGNDLNRPPHESDIAEQLRHQINGGGVKFDLFSRDYLHRGNIYVSYQDINRDSYFGTQQNPDAYGTTLDKTLVAGIQYTYLIEKFWFAPAELTAGFEYNENRLHDKILGYGRDFKQTSRIAGAYLQNEWKNSYFNFVIGARLDKHNKVDNPVVCPRVSLRYAPFEELIFRTGYAGGYRAPQAYDEDLHVGAVGGEVSIVELSHDLKPEYSHSVTLSADMYHNFGAVQANLLLEGFYTKLRDIFTLTENGHDAQGNLLLLRENASGATVAGLNAELRLSISDKNYLQLGYTFQKSRYSEAFAWSEDESVEPEKRMLRSPDNYGYATVNIEPFKRAAISLTAMYTGDMLIPHYEGYIEADRLEKTSSFFDAGIRLSYDFLIGKTTTLQINAGVKNVFDAFQSDIDKGMYRDSGYIYGPAMPRTYFFGVKIML